MAVIKRARATALSGKLPYSRRGNSASSRYTNDYETKLMAGKRHWNTIAKLRKPCPSGFGARTTDGPAAQPGCTIVSGEGYVGDITPIAQLLNDVGRQPRDVTGPFVYSSEVVPTASTSVYSSGVTLTSDEIGMRHNIGMLPPSQNTHVSGFQAKPSSSISSSVQRYGGEVTVANETQRSVFANKYGQALSADVNPIHGVALSGPVDQQGYQPNQLESNARVTKDIYRRNGTLEETNDPDNTPKSYSEAGAEGDEGVTSHGLITTAVANYLWSRGRHSQSSVAPVDPSTQSKASGATDLQRAAALKWYEDRGLPPNPAGMGYKNIPIHTAAADYLKRKAKATAKGAGIPLPP